MRQARPQLRGTLTAVALAGLVCAPAATVGCRRGGSVPEVKAPVVRPYPGYFQAQLGEEVYLLADLYEKIRFDLEPASLSYAQFISRTGQRVFISSAQPDLVERIEVAYEQAVDTELVPADAPGAPPAATPPPTTTRRVRPSTEPVESTTKAIGGGDSPATKPATEGATRGAARPSTAPGDGSGPVGDGRARRRLKLL